MTFPAINLRRVYLIARRDFLGYVKTWGFWISFFLPVIFGGLGFVAAQLDINVEPVRYETILDETGVHGKAILELRQQDQSRQDWRMIHSTAAMVLGDTDYQELERIYNAEGSGAARAFIDTKIPGFSSNMRPSSVNMIFVDPPADTIEGIQPYVRGEKAIMYEGADVTLNGVLHIHDNAGKLSVNYWSSNVTNEDVMRLAERYFEDRATRAYLSTGGLTPEGLRSARRSQVDVAAYDPTKELRGETDTQAVTIRDRIPFIMSWVLAAILWLTVFSGSYMLLTSMLEEKLNKLMEMMLASTRFSEIIFGKLIGVAALTLTAMLPYLLIGVAATVLVAIKNPEAALGISDALTLKLMIFFPLFLLLGYVFYGAFFIALGALAESMQDAQTLTTPIMLVLTACVMVVPLSMNAPDSPLLTFAAWFPLSAPFANIARLPLDPSWWELSLSALFVFVLSVGVIWIAGRIFRYGILSGSGVKGVRRWIARVIFRRKPV